MPVPTTIADLSVSTASNSPSDSDQVFPQNDDFLRIVQAIIRRGQAISATTLTASSTVAIGAVVDGDFINVSGNTAITAFDTIAAGILRTVRFTGAPLLTHNGTSLILPTGGNIQIVANDIAVFRSLGSGNWICEAYTGSNVAYLSRANTFTGINTFTASQILNNNVGLQGKTTAGTPRSLAYIDNLDITRLGDSNLSTIIQSSDTITIGNNRILQGRNVGDTASKTLVYIDNVDSIHAGDVTRPLLLDSSGAAYIANHAGTSYGILQRLIPFAITFVQHPTTLWGNYNIASVSNPATGQYLVNLTNPISSTITNTVTVTPKSTSAIIATYDWVTTSQARIYFFDAAGAAINVSFSVSITDLAN